MKLLRWTFKLGLSAVFLIQAFMAKPVEAQTNHFKSFTDWCLNKEKVSQQAKHTIDILLQRAGTTECHQANQRISLLDELKIVVSQISDVSPIASITHLKALTLSGNQIVDISPLQSLTNLTNLNLAANQIRDITPIKSLTQLTSLSLASNQIKDITPIKSLTQLTSLDLSSNQIKDTTPLDFLTSLSTLNIQGNPASKKACRQIVRHGYAGVGSGRINCHL